MMATGLAGWLRDAGLRVEEIAGWQERGHGELGDPSRLVVVDHHTAGSPVGRAPSLSTVLYGVPGVPGPLANVLQTREPDGNDAFLVIAAGTSYNAGSGGYAGVTGNRMTIGLEVEHVGTVPYPAERALITQKFNAAVLRGLGQPDGSRTCQHFEWSDAGKIDIGTPKVDGSGFRAMTTAIMRGQSPVEPAPKKGTNMILVIVTSDGAWCRKGEFYVVNAPYYAKRVGVEANGQPQPLEQVLGDWGFLPYGDLPGVVVDEWITSAIAAFVRDKKTDKVQAAVTLP